MARTDGTGQALLPWALFSERFEAARSLPSALVGDPGYINRVVRIAPGILVKNTFEHPSFTDDLYHEVMAARYAKRNTTIPIPRVLALGRSRRAMCVEECPGVTLASCLADMSNVQVHHITLQLRDYVGQLRSLKHNFGPRHIGSVNGGPFNNHLFVPAWLPKHPFDSVNALNQYFHEALLLTDPTQGSKPFVDEVITELPLNSSVKFCHCDLAPRNIIVQGSTITGIIDWSFAGWYPDYWEYGRMMQDTMVDEWGEKWESIVHGIFPPRPQEFRAFSRLYNALRSSGVWP